MRNPAYRATKKLPPDNFSSSSLIFKVTWSITAPRFVGEDQVMQIANALFDRNHLDHDPIDSKDALATLSSAGIILNHKEFLLTKGRVS